MALLDLSQTSSPIQTKAPLHCEAEISHFWYALPKFLTHKIMRRITNCCFKLLSLGIVWQVGVTRIGGFCVMKYKIPGGLSLVNKYSNPQFLSVGLANGGQSPIVYPCWMNWQNLVSEPAKLKPEGPVLINMPISIIVCFSLYLMSNNSD